MMTLMKINISHHPLIEDKIARLRDKQTSPQLFRALVNEITTLVAYEATKDWPLVAKEVTTPLTTITVKVLKNKKLVLVPVLRAGLGMVESCLSLLPQATVWHLGMKRDEQTLQPVVYYNNLQHGQEIEEAFIIDPMLATGGTNCAAIAALREKGVKNITLLCILAAPEGVKAINERYPEVPIFGAMLDEKLTETGYIWPGLGDAGDRLFGT